LARRIVIAMAPSCRLDAASCTVSAVSTSSSATTSDASLVAANNAAPKRMAPYHRVAGAPETLRRMPAGTTATAPVMPEIRPSLELASTSSSCVRTVDGTSADFETMYVFCSTSEAKTSGKRASASM
jgi:hypothetical protein